MDGENSKPVYLAVGAIHFPVAGLAIGIPRYQKNTRWNIIHVLENKYVYIYIYIHIETANKGTIYLYVK